jgi:hypothetical protein
MLNRGNALQALNLLAADSSAPELEIERLALRVIALCRAGRPEEGVALRTQYLKRYPNSPMIPRVREGCVDSQEGGTQ